MTHRVWLLVVLAFATPAPAVRAGTFGGPDQTPAPAGKQEAAPAAAKSPGERPTTRRVRLSMSWLSFAGKVGTGAIESSMRAAQLDQPMTAEDLAGAASLLAPLLAMFGGGGSDFEMPSYPDSTAFHDASRTFTLGYRVRPAVEVAAALDRDMRRVSETVGRHGNPGAHLWVTSEIRSATAMISYNRPSSVARLGMGLSVNSLRVATQGAQQRHESKVRPGLVAEAGLAMPSRSRAFVELTAQYRYVLPATFRAVPVPDENGTVFTTLPRTSMSFNRWVCSFGIGLRL